MNTSYTNILGAVREYAADFAAGGYTSNKASAICGLLSKEAPLPLNTLFDTFSCNAFERMSTVLGLAALLDVRTSDVLMSRLDCPCGCVTPQALCALILGCDFSAECAVLFASDGVLYRLFDGTAPTYNAPMALKPSIRDFLITGEADKNTLTRLDNDAVVSDTHLGEAVDAIVGALTSGGDIPIVINLSGARGSGRRTALRLASARCGISFALADDKLPIDELSTLLALTDTYPVLCASGDADTTRLGERLSALAEENGIAVVLSDEPLSLELAEADVISITVPLPSIALQGEIWARKSAAYSVAEDVDFREIAMEFNLPPGSVDKALRYAFMNSQSAALTAADIKLGCYRAVGVCMGSHAVKVSCAFAWDDLVLPAHSKRLLRTACDYVRYGCTVYEKWGFGRMLPYGRGASMIFTGPPGTGKTMAAQVIANELGLALYKVNLASVVSKYIGETEKNLNDIFERAGRSRVVLFFDEADVLFGKRTEVKDSNDKYSNMEAAFLLQKIEEYTGVAILATNYVQNFDEAFKRRMKFLVEFPFPGKEERTMLWHKVFPAEVPVGVLDYDYLVENFELSGSSIKNIAVHSAFLAASRGDGTIEMKHIVSALKNEFAKSGKSFTKAEAGEYLSYLED